MKSQNAIRPQGFFMDKFLMQTGMAALLLLASSAYAHGAEKEIESLHIGFLHPNGVDVFGYSSEKRINNTLYRFYTFGLPSIAAIGINYYASGYGQNGFNATIGAGIGSVAYLSLAYRWRLDATSNLKLGAGYTAGVAYSGAYPVLSYEHQFSP